MAGKKRSAAGRPSSKKPRIEETDLDKVAKSISTKASETDTSYGSQLRSWTSWCEANNIDMDVLDQDLPDHISRWLVFRIMISGLSKSTLDQCYSSVKQYYRQNHKRAGIFHYQYRPLEM